MEPRALNRRSPIMKKQLLLVSVLALGVSGAAQATYPSDAEWSQIQFERNASTSNSWGVSKRQVEPHNPFPFGGGYIDD
jgi:hypothetical protein